MLWVDYVRLVREYGEQFKLDAVRFNQLLYAITGDKKCLQYIKEITGGVDNYDYKSAYEEAVKSVHGKQS